MNIHLGNGSLHFHFISFLNEAHSSTIISRHMDCSLCLVGVWVWRDVWVFADKHPGGQITVWAAGKYAASLLSLQEIRQEGLTQPKLVIAGLLYNHLKMTVNDSLYNDNHHMISVHWLLKTIGSKILYMCVLIGLCPYVFQGSSMSVYNGKCLIILFCALCFIQ